MMLGTIMLGGVRRLWVAAVMSGDYVPQLSCQAGRVQGLLPLRLRHAQGLSSVQLHVAVPLHSLLFSRLSWPPVSDSCALLPLAL